MPIIAGLPTWTPTDEELLRELTERKALFTQRARGPLWNYVDGCLPRPIIESGVGDSKATRINRLVDWLIADADTIRDLLQPFDSGERPPRASD